MRSSRGSTGLVWSSSGEALSSVPAGLIGALGASWRFSVVLP
ncbi:MAG: hypothetical protein ACXWVH_06140 [Caulobacteraceae bacterium]